MDSAGSGMEPDYGYQRVQCESPQRGRTVGFSAASDPFTGDRWTNDEMSEGISGQERGELTPEQQAEALLRQAENLEPDYDFESAEGGNGSPLQEGQGQQVEQSRAVGYTTEVEYTGGVQGQYLLRAGVEFGVGQGSAEQAINPGCTGQERAVDPGWTGSECLLIGAQFDTGGGIDPGCTGNGRLSMDAQFTTGRGIDPGWTENGRLSTDAQFTTGRGIDPGWTENGRLSTDAQFTTGCGIDPGWTENGRLSTGAQFTAGRGIDPGWTENGRLSTGAQFTAGRGFDPGCTGNERLLVDGQVTTVRGDLPGCTGSGRGVTGAARFEQNRDLELAGGEHLGVGSFSDAERTFWATPTTYQGGAEGQFLDRRSEMWNGQRDRLGHTDAHRGEGRGSSSRDSARVEALEALVMQLLQREAGSSTEGRGSDRVGPVQSLSSMEVDRRSLKEGRGLHGTGEPKQRLGKGIGVQHDNGVPVKVFQPPWTSFQPATDAVSPAKPMTQGPGQ